MNDERESARMCVETEKLRELVHRVQNIGSARALIEVPDQVILRVGWLFLLDRQLGVARVLVVSCQSGLESRKHGSQIAARHVVFKRRLLRL